MRAIRRGDRGAAVAEIRSILHGLGLLDPQPAMAAPVAVLTPAAAGDISGQRSIGIATAAGPEFDGPTERAVRELQQSRGLTADGLVDEETWRALDAARWRLGARTLYQSVP